MADTFRRHYAPLTEYQKNLMDEIKIKAEELEALYIQAQSEIPGSGRLIAIGLTHLEVSVAMAVKGVTTDISKVQTKE